MSCCCFAVVSQSTAGIMESVGGQFDDVIPPGCTCYNPCSQRYSGCQTLRPQMLRCDVTAFTKDSASISLKVAIVFRAVAAEVHRAYYSMSATGDQVRSLVVSNLRSYLPERTLDEVFLEKSTIADKLRQTIGVTMQTYGFELVDVLIEDVDVRGTVRESLNQQVFQKYNRVSQQILGDIQKIKQVKAAEAEAEVSRLRGEGTAKERAALATAFQHGMEGFSHDGKVSQSELTALMLMTQYFDMLNDVAKNGTVRPASYFMPVKKGRLDQEALRERLKKSLKKMSNIDATDL